jgi:hypothetical protein
MGLAILLPLEKRFVDFILLPLENLGFGDFIAT